MKIKQVLNSVNTKHIRGQLRDLYHRKGSGRKPLNPISMLKAQLLKHLLRIPSDRRLALRLKHDRRTARICGFKKQTPSHGLFTHFRHRLGQDTYKRIFNHLLRGLLEDGAVKGDVIAVDSTHVEAYSRRASDNRTGKSDPEARVGRGKHGFTLGYRVHTARAQKKNFLPSVRSDLIWSRLFPSTPENPSERARFLSAQTSSSSKTSSPDEIFGKSPYHSSNRCPRIFLIVLASGQLFQSSWSSVRSFVSPSRARDSYDHGPHLRPGHRSHRRWPRIWSRGSP